MKSHFIKALGVAALLLFAEGLALERVTLNPRSVLSMEVETVIAGDQIEVTHRRVWTAFTVGMILVILAKELQKREG